MDQASSVRNLIHHDTYFRPDSRILEVACGVGAQTAAIASRLSGSHLIAFDKIHHSVQLAAKQVGTLKTVHLVTADLYHAPFPSESFDVVFIS